MNYYKADKNAPKSDRDLIIDNYLKGMHFTRDKYKSAVKTQLSEGTTKYNIEFLRETKELINQFSTLTVIESMLIYLTKECTEKYSGLLGNLWHIMAAQKGTISYMCILSQALKTFKIQHKNVYDAINEDLYSTKERLERNKAFMDIFGEQAGIKPIITVIKEQYGKSLYEFTFDINRTYFEEHRQEFVRNRDLYIENEINNYINIVKQIATDNNIDIHLLIENELEKKQQQNEETKKRIKAVKKSIRHRKLKRKADDIFTANDALILRSLETSNSNTVLSDTAYATLIDHLKLYNGIIYVIETVKGNSIYYLSNNDKETATLAKAKYFIKKSDTKPFMDKLTISDENHIHRVHKITLPGTEYVNNTIESDHVITDDEIIAKQNESLYQKITSIIDASYSLKIAKRLKNNDGHLYYIIAIKNTINYDTVNADYTCLLSINPKFYDSQKDAEKDLQNIKNNPILQYHNLYVVDLQPVCNKICDSVLSKFETHVLETLERFNRTENDTLGIFNYQSSYDNFHDLISHTKHLYTVIYTTYRHGIDHIDFSTYFMSIGSLNNGSTKISKTQHVTKNTIFTSSRKQAKSLFDEITSKYHDKASIINLVELIKTKNGISCNIIK